ncbi:MAG: NUDIX domain-containing protein [Caldilineaceae bacterium]
MKASEQGLQSDKPERYRVTPRTLIFVTSRHPQTQRNEVLLIKGAPTKRLWAGKYNGIGGHIESSEDVYQAAQRELTEETGLTDVTLALRGVVNIAVETDPRAPAGVMVFVFAGESDARSLQGSPEGEPAWIPLDDLADYPLVDDLYELIPLISDSTETVYGHYRPQADGAMQYSFQQPKV